MSVKDYLESKGLKCQPSGTDNLQVQDCPLCEDRKSHFYIHAELGLWRCVKCEASGNLYQLKCHFGDIEKPIPIFDDSTAEDAAIPLERVVDFERGLTEDSPAFQYLQHRGLDSDTILNFRLGLAVDQQGYSWITIPYFRGDTCIDIKYRSVPPAPKMFRKESGAQPSLFNEDAIRTADEVLLTEGEMDCIALHQLGQMHAVSLPLGAGTFKPEYWDLLAAKRKVYLLTDHDVKGDEAARKVAERLDPSRCFRVILPGVKDANEFLTQQGTAEELEYLLQQAQPMGPPRVYSVPAAMRELTQRIQGGAVIEGPTYPWRRIRDIFGPMGPAEMSVILGSAGVGKTSYVLQALTHVARQCQTPAMMMCLEMSIDRLAQLLVSQVTLAKHRNQIETAHVVRAMAMLQKAPIYFVRRPRELTWDNIRDSLYHAIRRHGIKVWAVDNIQFLARSDNVVQETARLSRNFKLLAEETRSHLLLVSHPRKPPQGKENRIPGQYDAAWTHSLAADADTIHSIHRKEILQQRTSDGKFGESYRTYDETTVISAAKTRYGEGGKAILRFYGPAGVFMEEPPPAFK